MKNYKTQDFNHLENIVAKELQLRPTAGSGAVKGDGDSKGYARDNSTLGQILNESKFTEKVASTISVNKSDWLKTEKAAIRYGRIPIMTRGDKSGRIFVVMDLDDFKYIYNGFTAYQNTKV